MLGNLNLSVDILIAITTGSCAVIALLTARILANRRKSMRSLILFRKQEKELRELHHRQQEKELEELHQRLASLEDSSRREVLLFSEITSILGNIQDSEQSLRAAFGRMLDILSIDFGILELATRPTLTVKVFEACDESLLESMETVGLRGWVLEEKFPPFNAFSFEEYQKSKHFRVMKTAQSLLCVPCKVKAVRVGYFIVGCHQPHQYTPMELEGLHFCAEQFAVTYQMHTQVLDTQELSQLRHDYIANVSHELRTPLTTIYGYLSMLKSFPAQTFPEDEKQEMFSVMTDECQRLIRLINNLLLSVKVEQEDFSGKMNPVAVSLAHVVAQTCRFMDRELKSKSVELKIDVPEDLAQIEGNFDLLYQVFQNLIANSIKFCAKEPQIEIWAREEDECVAVRVSDNGVGIEKQAIPKVFQKFYRAESQAASRPGLGIGLYLVQKLVQLHQGDIQVTSELNKGTTFSLRFPKLKAAPSLSQLAAG